MRSIAAASMAAMFLLASCQSPAKMQAQDEAFCRSIGATENMYVQCMMQRDASRQADRADRLNRSAALMAASAQVMATPQPRPTTTTCNKVGQSVVCNTF